MVVDPGPAAPRRVCGAESAPALAAALRRAPRSPERIEVHVHERIRRIQEGIEQPVQSLLLAQIARVLLQPALALRWLLQRPGVTAPIIGARTLAHLESNLGAAGWTLSPAQMAQLTEVSEPELPYPYDFITRAAPARC